VKAVHTSNMYEAVQAPEPEDYSSINDRECFTTKKKLNFKFNTVGITGNSARSVTLAGTSSLTLSALEEV